MAWLRSIGIVSVAALGALSLLLAGVGFDDAHRYHDRSCPPKGGEDYCIVAYLGRQPLATRSYLVVGACAAAAGIALLGVAVWRTHRVMVRE